MKNHLVQPSKCLYSSLNCEELFVEVCMPLRQGLQALFKDVLKVPLLQPWFSNNRKNNNNNLIFNVNSAVIPA